MDDLAVSYKSGDQDLTITAEDVRQYICPSASIKEIKLFLELCAAKHMNPYLKDAHLIKYGDNPATIVTGKDYFVRTARTNADFDGFKAGIVLIDQQGNIHKPEGSNPLPGMSIIGGWAMVFTKSCSHEFYEEVSFSEYAGTKYDRKSGQQVLNTQWAKMPGTMIRKVALVHALREAFPGEFGGLYDSCEMNVEVNDEPINQFQAMNEVPQESEEYIIETPDETEVYAEF